VTEPRVGGNGVTSTRRGRSPAMIRVCHRPSVLDRTGTDLHAARIVLHRWLGPFAAPCVRASSSACCLIVNSILRSITQEPGSMIG
jgi:hypothetical protein